MEISLLTVTQMVLASVEIRLGQKQVQNPRLVGGFKVSTHLKNISQIGKSSPIFGVKIQKMFETSLSHSLRITTRWHRGNV